MHGRPVPLEPGTAYDVEVVLDACAYEWSPGQVLRISVAGTDWPNTIAPPAPVTLTVHDVTVELPVLIGDHLKPTFGAGAEHSTESDEGVAWEVHDNVLGRVTSARTVSVSQYETPHDGTAREDYRGEVSVDRRTFAQHAHADTTYEPDLAGRRDQGPLGDGDRRPGQSRRIVIDTWAWRDGQEVSHRTWRETT